MPKPIEGTFPEYFATYIKKVAEDDVLEALHNQQHLMDTFFNSIPKDKWDFAYAPGKWTLKQMLQHIIDTERIFAYRSLCISRKETQSLPGFDENSYVANSNASNRSPENLLEELKAVRRSTVILFESFNPDMLNNSGLSNNNIVTVNALGYITAGHVYHHIAVINGRYLLT